VKLAFEDFYPQQTERPGLFTGGKFESFEGAVRAANEWVDKSGIHLLNVETVVLPNMWRSGEEGTVDAQLPTHGLAQWYQFVRVWYLAR
jgi:hypothetical protein